MLERATACLKSGVARESLRCVAAKAPRSKRTLHSAFFTHGAGDLDLPPWATAMLPMPADLPLRHDDQRGEEHGRSLSAPQGAQHPGQSMTDGVFLDFLYPQQALALLHKRSAQCSQRWEKRNARRLPDGFVVASRGYASRSRTPKVKRAGKQKRSEEQLEDEKEGQASVEERSIDRGEGMAQHDEDLWETSPSDPWEAKLQPANEHTAEFADSPLDLAEAPPEAIRKLRNIMSFSRKSVGGLSRQRETVEQAWRLYQTLDDAGQGDTRLKIEFLTWLSSQQTENADVHCGELYHSMATEQRTLQVYEVALSMFLRNGQHLSASKLHREALQNIENGHQISRTLFRYSLDNGLWRLAIRTESRHREFYGQSSQMRMFWLHVSEIPGLLSRAIKLVTFLTPAVRQRRVDAHTQQFCARFFKEAITQEFLQADASLFSLEAASKKFPPRHRVRLLFYRLLEWGEDSADFFEAVLMALTAPNTRIPYSRMHNLVTTIYNVYKSNIGARPSERLLSSLLDRVTGLARGSRTDRQTMRSLSVASVVKDWKIFHGRLNEAAHARLVTFHAISGRVEDYDAALEQYKEEHPDSRRRSGLLWTSIYIHARRADLDAAQHAFATVKRELSEHEEAPDLRCWNALLHAHSRADDLQGGLINLENLIHYAKLTPDGYSFHPLTEMFAKRGDVDGVEDLLEQYDELTRAPRSTPLLGSLITAFVRSDDVANAEHALRDVVDKVRKGDVTGSLTKCFNIVLTAYASSRDIDATKRVYRWMRESKIKLDVNSYSALILALTVRRQTDAAYRIVTSAMREAGVEPTAFHFGLIIDGYNNAGRSHDAARVEQRMVELNLKPGAATTALHLRTHALREHHAMNEHEFGASRTMPMEATLKELDEVLAGADPSNLATKAPNARLQSASLHEDHLASHFDYLIFLHGKRRCFEAVGQLYQRYEDLAAERGMEHDSPPIKLMTAMMRACWRAGDYEQVEASWRMVKERADTTAPIVPVPTLKKPSPVPVQTGQRVPDALELEPLPVDADQGAENDQVQGQPSSKTPKSGSSNLSKRTLLAPSPSDRGPKPSPARRHILTRPLRYYLAALHAQGRTTDLIATVASLLRQGYTLDNRTFNYFVECLCRTTPPLALLAFTLTERFLMSNFPGWVHAKNRYAYVYANRPQARAEGLQNLRARYLRPGTLMPQYRLLVRLGSVLLDVRRLEAMGRRRRSAKGKSAGEVELERYVGTMAHIRKRAPKTLYAVQSMPYRPDRMQSRLLRRES